LDRTVVVAKEATQSTQLDGPFPGERVTVRELMAGLFLDSGNDAARPLAARIVPRDRFIAR